MGRNKSNYKIHDADPSGEQGNPFRKRQRKERINQPPSKLNVDVHGILFAVVAVVFVVYVENLDEVREALRGTPWAADPVLTA